MGMGIVYIGCCKYLVVYKDLLNIGGCNGNHGMC